MSGTSARRSSRWLLVTACVAALFWIVDLGILRAGTPHPLDDTWEDGLVARSLLRGDGLRSPLIYPPLWELRDPVTLTVPVLVHGPLLPYLLAGAVGLLGPGVLDHVAWVGGLVAWLTIFPLFRLGTRLRDEIGATAAVLLFTFSPILLEAVHHSVSEVLGCLFVTLALERLTARPSSVFVAGLLLGLAYLVRAEMTIAALIVALLLWRGAGQREAVRLAAGFTLVATPWWIHNLMAAGSPLFNLSTYLLVGYWGDRPRYQVFMDPEFAPGRWLPIVISTLPTMWPKWLHYLPRAAAHLLEVPSLGTGWLAVVGAGLATFRRDARAEVLAALALAAIPIAVMVLMLPQVLHVVPFLGLWVLAAAGASQDLSRRFFSSSRATAATVAALAVLTLPFTVAALARSTREARVTARLLATERRALAVLNQARPDSRVGPLFSDRPGFVAWTIGRTVIYADEPAFRRLYSATASTSAGGLVGWVWPWDPRNAWMHDGHWSPGRPAELEAR